VCLVKKNAITDFNFFIEIIADDVVQLSIVMVCHPNLSLGGSSYTPMSGLNHLGPYSPKLASMDENNY